LTEPFSTTTQKEISMKNLFALAGLTVVLMFVALLFMCPFLVIWAVNTLFPQANLGYTFWNWLAVVLLGVFFRGDSVGAKSK
jgi:hypothetical protein